MKNIYLVSADFVRGESNIDDNLQNKYLMPAIRETQDADLTEVLGCKLVHKLCELVDSGEITDEANEKYKNLLDNCQYFMAYSAIAKLILITSVKISNFGADTAKDEHIYTLSLKDLYTIKDEYTIKADYYKGRLQAFLRENYNDYPELKGSGCNCIQPELHSKASTSIFLGGRRGRGYYKGYIGK